MKIGKWNCHGGLAFKTELVPLITSGKKTRTVRTCPPGIDPGGSEVIRLHYWNGWQQLSTTGSQRFIQRRFNPGDFVFLKEPIQSVETEYGTRIAAYVSDGETVRRGDNGHFIPYRWTMDPVHGMNTGGETARTILQIKDVRFECLGDMTSADAMAEGVRIDKRRRQPYWIGNEFSLLPICAFIYYWDTLAKTKAEKWDAMYNKLVRVITFRVEATAPNQYKLLGGKV